LAVHGIVCATDVAAGSFLDRVNLIAHEAGHLLFSYFGQFVMVLGGTVGQLFVPVAFTVYFFMRKEFYSSAVTLFWTGQNFFGISLYVKDAQAMALPLVSVGGGEAPVNKNRTARPGSSSFLPSSASQANIPTYPVYLDRQP